jgi:hypothetical protein
MAAWVPPLKREGRQSGTCQTQADEVSGHCVQRAPRRTRGAGRASRRACWAPGARATSDTGAGRGTARVPPNGPLLGLVERAPHRTRGVGPVRPARVEVGLLRPRASRRTRGAGPVQSRTPPGSPAGSVQRARRKGGAKRARGTAHALLARLLGPVQRAPHRARELGTRCSLRASSLACARVHGARHVDTGLGPGATRARRGGPAGPFDGARVAL